MEVAAVHVLHRLPKSWNKTDDGGHFVGKVVDGVGNAAIQAVQRDPGHVGAGIRPVIPDSRAPRQLTQFSTTPFRNPVILQLFGDAFGN